jgi:MFS family permease
VLYDLKGAFRRLRGLRREAWAIIGGLFVVGVGNYMVIPFFALYCTKQLGLSSVQVGMLLTMRLWTQRGCALVGGMLADRLTPRRVMIAGMLCRFAGFLGIAASGHFYQLAIFTALTGFGSALYTPAGKSALIGLSASSDKLLILALRNTAYNVGGALGPIIGLAGAFISYRWTLVGGAALFIAAAIAIALLVTDRPAAQRTRPLALRGARALLADHRVFALCVALAVFFAFYVQLELTLPLFANHAYSDSAVALLFIANAAVTILLQLPLSGWIERLNLTSALAVGFGCTGLGFLLIAVPLGLPGFVLGMIVFSLGEILVEPKIDSEIGEIAPASLLGTGFGLASLACSIGGAVGHELGAVGLPMAARHGGEWWFFLVLGIAGVISAYVIAVTVRAVAVQIPETRRRAA